MKSVMPDVRNQQVNRALRAVEIVWTVAGRSSRARFIGSAKSWQWHRDRAAVLAVIPVLWWPTHDGRP
jgi:hypothetical protein